MKTKIQIGLIAMVMIALISQNTNAQVQTGAVVDYSVTGSGTINAYHWNVTGGTFVPGANPYQIRVTWGAAGPGVITVYPESDHGCYGATQTLNVTITNTLPVTLAIGTISDLCPYEAANLPAGGDPSATLTLAGATPVGNWSITYSSDGGTTWKTLNSISGTTPTVTFDESFTNASATTSAAHSIIIRDWTVNSTLYTPAIASRPTANFNVYPTPSVTGITTP